MTDNSKEYIKMSKKAEKIQEKWKLKAGDFFTRSLNDLIYCLEQTELDVINCGTKKGGIGSSPMKHSDWIDGKIWLPKQDQLQNMINFNYRKFGALYYLCKFGCVGKTNSYFSEFNSMEQLWLAFVMYELYQKKWNGEDWVYEK